MNGISTFTKDAQQQAMFDALPLDRIVLETDAPFLAPVGHRGKQNQPAWVKDVAAYHPRGVLVTYKKLLIRQPAMHNRCFFHNESTAVIMQ